MFSGLFFWFFLLNMKIKRFRLNPMLYVFSGLFHHQIPSNGSRKHFKINYMSQVRACLSLHEYTPRKLKELVATRFDNIVGSCYNKIWRNILSVRKWLWPTKKRLLWICMMKLRESPTDSPTQYPHVTVFQKGLAHFRGLYYFFLFSLPFFLRIYLAIKLLWERTRMGCILLFQVKKRLTVYCPSSHSA